MFVIVGSNNQKGSSIDVYRFDGILNAITFVDSLQYSENVISMEWNHMLIGSVLAVALEKEIFLYAKVCDVFGNLKLSQVGNVSAPP